MEIKQLLRKYFIMGSQNCIERTPEVILKEAIEGGITLFQFREKGKNSLVGEHKLALGKRLRQICKQHNIPFIVNDDIELVEQLKSDGIHVGQEDLPVEEIRQRFPDLLIGLSISNEKELANSNLKVVDYVGAGPVFPTNTKEDAKNAVGLDWIRTLRSKHPELPIVGIGGITKANAKHVIEAGADGVAVISAITLAENIAQTVEAL